MSVVDPAHRAGPCFLYARVRGAAAEWRELGDVTATVISGTAETSLSR